MAKESVVWYSEKCNEIFENSTEEAEKAFNELGDDVTNKMTIEDLFALWARGCIRILFGEEITQLTLGEIDSMEEEDKRGTLDKLKAIMDDESMTKEFFPKG